MAEMVSATSMVVRVSGVESNIFSNISLYICKVRRRFNLVWWCALRRGTHVEHVKGPFELGYFDSDHFFDLRGKDVHAGSGDEAAYQGV